MPNICTTCTNTVEEPYTLCEHCEIQHTINLLHVYTMLDPLRLLVDASVHVGDDTHHHGSDVAPTPVRLPVLDLLDLVDAIISGYYARLNPPTGSRPRQQPLDIESMILAITSDDRLNQLPDIGMYVSEIARLEQHMSTMHDYESKQAIGHCLNPLCGVTIYATDSERTVTCATCSMVQNVDDVRLTFWQQCLASDKLVTPTQATQLLNLCGIHLPAATIRQWAYRGKLHQADGYYHLNDISKLARTSSGLTKI